MKNQFHPKYQRKYFWISALKFFVAFWGLLGSFLGFQQPSLFMILLMKSPGSPKSFQEVLVFWMKLIFHMDILKLTDLQETVQIRGKFLLIEKKSFRCATFTKIAAATWSINKIILVSIAFLDYFDLLIYLFLQPWQNTLIY